MKLLAFFIATFFISATEPGATWLTNFEQAKTVASQSKKLILLNFSGSDWCGPCIRLKEEIFAADTFIKYAEENLVLANADFPRLRKNQLEKNQAKQNEEVADKYNPQGKFPLTLLLDASGKLIKRWEGMPSKSPEQFVEEIRSMQNAAD